MEHLEVIAKIASIVVSVISVMVFGGRWIVNRIESGQKEILDQQKIMLKKINKKVSHTECKKNQANCPCVLALNQTKEIK